ncbi:brother of CDO-like isoform X2 [Anthonomus grandis grandis]|nr:brother of CDO-like isoform X2 [Anthonomus grandis grandis]
MSSISRFCAVAVALAVLLQHVCADFEYLVSKPESLILPRGYETLLSCEMNIQPDKFQWKFYPSSDPYNSKVNIFLSNDSFKLIPEDRYRVTRKKSELSIKVNEENAGDYQCLAYYGASVVASVPWTVTMATMGDPPYQSSVSTSVQSGNTVSWRCEVPESNPPAFVEYNKGDKYVASPLGGDFKVRSMILRNVSVTDSGTYRCTTTNSFVKKDIAATLKLEVLKNARSQAPTFISKPLDEYTATKGSDLFLECSAVGKPIPKTTWLKKHSQLPTNRIEMVPGGLIIRNITSKDDGVYVCNHTNEFGSLSHQMIVKYNEEPSVNCFLNSTDIKQGENMDIVCDVKGTPEPQVSWFLNGFSVINDSRIEAIGNKIYFRPIEKRHAGNLQIFARNVVKTVYSSISIRVIPLTSSLDEFIVPVNARPRHNHKKSQNQKRPSKHKTPKMVPPSKPVISRVKDDTVVVRWNVSNNNGLRIQFFKVQYKEVGPIRAKDNNFGGNKSWNTANTDIPPTITSFEISGLKSEYTYKFRVAAVYINNDSKMSATSKKFHLRRLDFDEKNPLPTCLITSVQTLNHTAIQIYWECPPSNVTVDGFYINYIVATTAGDDYMIVTVEDGNTRTYVVNYLQPDTQYDIKLQSFNSKLAGEFSPFMKGKTGPVPASPTVTTSATISNTKNAGRESIATSDNSIYIIIAGAVIGCALVVTGVILLFVCRKWQRKKLSGSRDKPTVDHHIAADSNDYGAEPKTIPRSNGCALPGNRITITSNPLAEADKNATVIEMRHLANNNVRSPQENGREDLLTLREKPLRRNSDSSGSSSCTSRKNSDYV